MLEQMRRRGASVFIYLIFGLLIAVFVINFGPRGGGEGGCRGPGNTVITVDGSRVNKTSYHVAFSNEFIGGNTSADRKHRALDWLIRRELLAQAASERGLRVTNELIEEEIKKGNFFIAGFRVPLGERIFDTHDDGTQTWNFRKYKRWVQSLDVSLNTYQEEQQRALQATMMADLLADSARVSRDEAMADYLYNNTTVAYDVVAFSPTAYRPAMLLTDADIARYLAGHEDEVQARYKSDERTYKDVKPQLKLRQIFIAKPEGGTTDEAKAKLEAARTAIADKKKPFAEAAKALATDEVQRANGGDMGWRSVSNPGLGEQAVSEAAKALAPGELTPVITTDAGAYLVMAEDKREGDLSYDQVKHEIARDLALTTWSKEAAKRAALAAHAAARAGDKPLGELYERSGAPGVPRDQHGSYVYESEDIPAASKTDDGPGGAAEPKPDEDAARPDAPKPDAAGDKAEPKAAEKLAPSSDVLPAFGKLDPPKVVAEGPVPRLPTMPGIGKRAGQVFDDLAEGTLAPEVVEVDGSYVLFQVTKKAQPKVEEFEKEADKTIAAMREVRGRVLVEDWLLARCLELAKADRIRATASFVQETDDEGRLRPQSYRPCSNVPMRR